MRDLEQRRNRRVVLPCENCPRRIATTTVRATVRPLYHPIPWKSQIKGNPVTYRRQGNEVSVDVVCRSCGHSATYPVHELPMEIR